MTDIHTGSCLCGAVTFTVNGPMKAITFCHCGQCRRQTGLYYASSNAVADDVTVVGEENVTWYHSSEAGRRGFCRHCGSALFWKAEGRSEISIMAGSLDQPTRLATGHHIYCADKGDFYEIQDNLPHHAQDAPTGSGG
jgi:hypothetical protein